MYIYIVQKNGVSCSFDIMSHFVNDNLLVLTLFDSSIISIRLFDILSYEIVNEKVLL